MNAAPVIGSQGLPAIMKNLLAWPGTTAELHHVLRIQWADALRAIVRPIRHICLGLLPTARVKDAALVDLDPADLSELGRERRRQALEALRDAARQLAPRACPPRRRTGRTSVSR